MPAVQANGLTIEYEERGASDAPVILLVMGFGAQLTLWPDDFCDTLADGGFRVIRFDNRDIGL
ncbi:MAG: alpha/beta hydrolase, partial [Minwuiales bacterium]|nr:alpha/beta hydrolase [Minwuiales bacterium]